MKITNALLIGFAFLMAAARPQDPEDARIDGLIEELKKLPDSPTREEFIGRSAMAELLIDGARAFPKIKHAFLTNDHWAIKASLACLLNRLCHGPYFGTFDRLTSLLGDENIVVRVVAALLLNHAHSGSVEKAAKVLARPAEAALSEKLVTGPAGFEWLLGENHVRWVERGLAFLERGEPLEEPSNKHGMRHYPPFTDLRGHGDERILKDQFQIAWNGLWDALQSGRGHEVIEIIQHSVEKDSGRDPGRLAVKLRLAGAILHHRDDACGNSWKTPDLRCERLAAVLPRFHAICDKWLKESADPWVMDAGVSLLNDLGGSGHAPAIELMEKLKTEHPEQGVRRMIEHHLDQLKKRRAETDRRP